jgi:hypothetical protein
VRRLGAPYDDGDPDMTKRLFPLSALALLMITGTALADDWSTVLAAADTDSMVRSTKWKS